MLGMILVLAFHLADAAHQARSSPIEVVIAEGSSRSAVVATAQPNVTGAPWAGIPARPKDASSKLTVAEFRVRAWIEGSDVRVLVFAVNRRPKQKDDETQIASRLMKPGQTIEVSETGEFGARPVKLTASAQR